MSADETFEEMEYIKSKNTVLGTFGYRQKHSHNQIVFYDTKEILKFDSNYDISGINMQELQAINQKCKELGWIE